jgi:Arc/MetJ family transcription regulator
MTAASYRRDVLYVYTDAMATTQLHRTTVDIEVDAFEEAREVLGTSGYRDTVNGALREVARLARLRHAADLIRAGKAPGPTPEELEELRRPRHV